MWTLFGPAKPGSRLTHSSGKTPGMPQASLAWRFLLSPSAADQRIHSYDHSSGPSSCVGCFAPTPTTRPRHPTCTVPGQHRVACAHRLGGWTVTHHVPSDGVCRGVPPPLAARVVSKAALEASSHSSTALIRRLTGLLRRRLRKPTYLLVLTHTVKPSGCSRRPLAPGKKGWRSGRRTATPNPRRRIGMTHSARSATYPPCRSAKHPLPWRRRAVRRRRCATRPGWTDTAPLSWSGCRTMTS